MYRVVNAFLFIVLIFCIAVSFLHKNFKNSFTKYDSNGKIIYNNQCENEYLKKDSLKYVWKNPSNLKVYIKGHSKRNYLFVKCFDAWSERTNGYFKFRFVNNEKDADIVCSYVSEFSRKPESKNQIGYTYNKFIVYDNKYGYLLKSDMEILLKLGRIPLSRKTVALDIMHEIGHALGVMTHSDNKDDIMYSNIVINQPFLRMRDFSSKISGCDYMAVKKLYGIK